MIDDVLLLIAGASGAGKTSVREAIAARLTLPSRRSRQRMAECAVVRANALDGEGRRRGDPEELLPHHVPFASRLRVTPKIGGYMPHVLTTVGWANMHWSCCAAVDLRRYRGSGAGLSSGPSVGALLRTG